MPKPITLYSNILATLMMVAFVLFTNLTGASTPSAGRSLAPGLGSKGLQGKVVVIDPGHGGADPGTVGIGPTTEAENVLAIAWDLKGMLEQAGAHVIMTRQTERSPAQGTQFANQQNGQLAARVGTANRSKGQIYISIHNDWNNNSLIEGTSVYFYKSQDLALAEALQKSLVRQLKSLDLGIRRGNLYVLRNTTMPAALVEVGFLSNPKEAALLARPNYRLEAARGIFAGIQAYFQGEL